jgi:hypothetical protein
MLSYNGVMSIDIYNPKTQKFEEDNLSEDVVRKVAKQNNKDRSRDHSADVIKARLKGLGAITVSSGLLLAAFNERTEPPVRDQDAIEQVVIVQDDDTADKIAQDLIGDNVAQDFRQLSKDIRDVSDQIDGDPSLRVGERFIVFKKPDGTAGVMPPDNFDR